MTENPPCQVIKVGGSILQDAAAYEAVAGLLDEEMVHGPTWVVVSAAQGVTDSLTHLGDPDRARTIAHLRRMHTDLGGGPLPTDLATELDAAEGSVEAGQRDELLSWGERASAVAMWSRLRARGRLVPIVELREPGPITDHPSAIVPGFYVRDGSGGIRCLPRGGGDISAVLLAAALGCRIVRLWKRGGGLRLNGRPVPEAPAPALIPHLVDPLRPVHISALWLADRWGIDLLLEDPFTGLDPTRIRSTSPRAETLGPPLRSARLPTLPTAVDGPRPSAALTG